MQYSVRSDGVLERVAANIARYPEWLPAIIRNAMLPLRQSGVSRMKEAIAKHRYTGALEGSISGEFTDGGYTLTISPKALRGNRWDAGVLLEQGTGPIPRAPWLPISRWAEFRGLPAVSIWLKIRAVGVTAHPFLERTLTATMPEVRTAAVEIVTQMAEKALFGDGTVSSI